MRAIGFFEHGGPEVLAALDLPEPSPGPGEVRVAVAACAVNRLDLWVRGGLPNLRIDLPHVLGSDIAGQIDAVGNGVDPAWVGRRVVVNPGLSCGACEACLSGWDNLCRRYRILGENAPGGYAERIVVPLANVVPIPEGDTRPLVEWAAVPLVFLTAWQMLVVRAKVGPGDVVLVHAVGSGVGSAAVQIARLFGARVVGLASTDEKLERARARGAEATVRSDDQDWPKKVRALPFVGKRGVDVVFEHVGRATFADSIKLARRGGVVVTCGASSGHEATIDLRHVFFRQIQILGSTMGSKALLHRIVPLVARGALVPEVARVLPLERAADAHRTLDERKTYGKIVLEVGEPAGP